jgi:hypothetical protein
MAEADIPGPGLAARRAVNGTTQRLCVWSGAVMIVMWLGGFWLLADFLPPPSPNLTAEEIAQVYLGHTSSIRWGLIFTVIGCAFLGPFVVAISAHMRRMEGRNAPMSQVQLILGAILVLEFCFPVIIMQSAAFRADRSPQTIQTLNDVAWLIFLALVSTAILQAASVGIAILRDHRAEPIMPRWMGYLSVFTSLSWVPGSFTVFFKTGPLAWDGVFVWWLPVGTFAVWLVAITRCMLVAIAKQEAAGAEVPEDAWELAVERRIEALTAEVAELRAARGVDA